MTKRSAADMVNRCFRHQHPEAYGRAEAAEAVVPHELRYGSGNDYVVTSVIAEEPMGAPDAIPF